MIDRCGTGAVQVRFGMYASLIRGEGRGTFNDHLFDVDKHEDIRNLI